MVAQNRISRVFSISLPPDLAAKAEELALEESRTMSELFREALRLYYAQKTRRALAEIGEYASTRNPSGYVDADIPRLIQETRAEERAEKPRGTRQTQRRRA